MKKNPKQIPELAQKLFLLVLTMSAMVAATPAVSHAQTLNVLYSFGAGGDGFNPQAGVTLDRSGNVYGTTCEAGSGNGGTVYRLNKRTNGTWVFNVIHEFDPANGDGSCPLGRVVFGPSGLLYGTTHSGGLDNYAGIVFSLQPPARACVSAICPWNENILYEFTNGADGAQPGWMDPIFDQAGNLYGTAQQGGAHGFGVVFELSPSLGGWAQSVLYSFLGTDAATPSGSLTFDSAGNLYGTTAHGFGQTPWGTVFELTPSGSGWAPHTLHAFQNEPDGADSYSGLTQDAAGNLYGVTAFGGSNGGGSAFELTPSGGSFSYSLIFGSFPGSGGPWGSLVMDSSGNLYGTAYRGGINSAGAVFKLTPSAGGWTYTSLHDFTGGSDGGYPYGDVTFDASGNLYGTTAQGGRYGRGEVWQITP